MRISDLVEKEGFTCLWCSRTMWLEDLTMDHLCPKSKGGKTCLENLAVACKKCNKQRKSKSLASYSKTKEREGFQPNYPYLYQKLEIMKTSSIKTHYKYAQKELKHLPSYLLS